MLFRSLKMLVRYLSPFGLLLFDPAISRAVNPTHTADYHLQHPEYDYHLSPPKYDYHLQPPKDSPVSGKMITIFNLPKIIPCPYVCQSKSPPSNPAKSFLGNQNCSRVFDPLDLLFPFSPKSEHKTRDKNDQGRSSSSSLVLPGQQRHAS